MNNANPPTLFRAYTESLPHGCQDNDFQQVAMQLRGNAQSCPLNGNWGDQAEDDAQAAEDAEHWQVGWVSERARLPWENTSVSKLISFCLFSTWLWTKKYEKDVYQHTV